MRVAVVCLLSLLAVSVTAVWASEAEAQVEAEVEAEADAELQVEGVADQASEQEVVTVANNHVERRPTRGYVHAEMMDRLPTAEELAEHAHVNAHSLDSALDAEGGALGGLSNSNGVMTTYSVESDALHGTGDVVHTHFSSQPLLSEAEQQEMDERNAEATTFTPDRLGGDGTHSEAAYLEVDGVQLLTETERMAMAETAAHVHSAAASQSRAGPRKYLVHSGFSNTGAVLARYEKQTALTCQERCEADSQCVGFTVARNPKKLNGICTLRSSWSSNVENAAFDSFQGHDFSVQPMPFQELSVYPKTTVAGQQLLIIADVSRVRTKRVQRTVELIASVDSNVPDAFWTNAPSNYPGVESFTGLSFAGITSPLDRAGDHTVAVQYSRAFATPVQGDSKGACQQQRLTAIPFPIELSPTRVYDVVGQHWNVAASSSLTAQNYAAIPGAVPEGESGAMQIKLAVPEDGARLLVFADINRVQHSNGWTNSVFRITVDGQEIAYANTGEHYGYQYRAVSLRAASGALKRGEHTVAVQAKTQHGRVYFLSDGHGFQQRRLTALIVPKGNLWNRKWNLGTAWLKPSKWADLPGAPMKLTFTTAAAGYLLINAGISRVQSWGNSNVELRLLLSGEGDDASSGEGQEIARTNTGNVNGWRFRDVAFHGTSALVGPGTHSVRVQVRSTSGSTVVFYNDANGYQQRRLSAVLIPASAGMKSVTHSGVTCTRPKPPTLPPAPPAKPPVPVVPTAGKPAAPAAPAPPAPAPAAPKA